MRKKLLFIIVSVLIISSFMLSGCDFFSVSSPAQLTRDDERYVEKINLPDGSTYSGEIRSGKPHGTGTLTYADNAVYVGEFSAGMRQGEGVMTFPDGAVYKGEYVRDRKNGEGFYKYADGREYRGGFKNDVFDGIGEMRWSDNIRYVGRFKNGEIYSTDTYSWPLRERRLRDDFSNNENEEMGFIIEGSRHTPYY